MGNSGRRYWWIAAAVIAGALLAPAGAEAAGGQVLLSDSFNGPTTTAPLVSLNSLTPGFPCLTAGTSTTATPVAGCDLASPDPDGSGVLRLTDANGSEASGMVYDTSFPTRAGLDITFDQYQYGGSGADGISFDLAVAPPQPAAIGPSGGALGYASNDGNPNPDGLPGGYLGVGLDTYGNFTNTFFDGAGCTDPSWAGATQFPNEVTVRGPGNGLTGYCLLSSSLQETPDPLGASGPIQLSTSAATRPAPEAVQILINPANGGSYTVGIDPTGGSDFQTVTSGPLPSSYYDPTTGAVVNGLPQRLTFALAASTGAFTDVHEISNVNATTLNGSVPILSLTSTDSGDGFANANNSLTYSLVAGVSASSPANETNPTSMVVTDTVPSDESIVGTPSGDGWNCSSSSSTTATCMNTSSAPLAPGATLPPISVQVELGAAATGSTIVNNAQLISSDAAAPVTGSDSVMVIVAQPSSVELTGSFSVTNGESAVLSGKLMSGGSAVAGRVLSFSLGTGAKMQACTGMTQGNGTASCVVHGVSQPDTLTTVGERVTWAGDPHYTASSAERRLTLQSPTGCTLTPTGKKVRLKRSGTAQKGVLTLDVRCKRAGSLKLRGTVTEKSGKRRRSFKIRLVVGEARTGVKDVLTVKLPAAALKALSHKVIESVTFTLTVNRAGHTGNTTVSIGKLRAVR